VKVKGFGCAQDVLSLHLLSIYLNDIGGNMRGNNENRESLKRRRDEILAELGRVNEDLRSELDPDGEEQAIQIEQDEVAVSMEDNLRRELNEIEDKLRGLNDD
jgi:RNA polymerase-binding transcription factor DksA